MAPERLAEIRKRANALVDGWPLYVTAPTTGAVDCRALLAEVDRLNDRVAELLDVQKERNGLREEVRKLQLWRKVVDAERSALRAKVSEVAADRDEARAIARGLRGLHHAYWPDPDLLDEADHTMRAALAVEQLPDWLTAVQQPAVGPHHDDSTTSEGN